LGRLFVGARGGESAALVVRGEAGIGKTALIEHAAGQASGFEVVRIAGVEFEMELPFAGLHQLCAPMLDHLTALPEPQRDALRVTFGLATGKVPDRFLVGLATLSLLSEVAQKRPLLCVIDDGQWLDAESGQVLGFVARRLLAESVLLLFAVREPTEVRHLQGLPDLTLPPLTDDDARALLNAAVPGRLDVRVRDRLVAETRGNPLALLELPRGMTAAELAGGFPGPPAQDLPAQIEESFFRRLESLPEPSRRLLLLAAAEPSGDVSLLWQAAGTLAIEREAAVVLDEEQLLEIDGHVQFRHPLVRSAIYSRAAPAHRREAHLALAEVINPQTDPDQRAWHRALAASGPDEELASELEQLAGRAQSRGGLAAAAAFLRRSVGLTEGMPGRVGRALSAAQVSLQAGELDPALNLVLVAEESTTDATWLARALLLRGQIAFAMGQWADAPPILVSAADKLRTLDLNLAREAYLNAWAAAHFGGESTADTLVAVSAAALRLPPSPKPRLPDLLLEGLATLMTAGRIEAAPILKRATAAFAEADASVEQGLRWGWLATMPASVLWDYRALDAVNARQLALARSNGALALLPFSLNAAAVFAAWKGDFAAARSAAAETATVAEATATPYVPLGAMMLAALRGRAAEATALFDSAEGAAQSNRGAGVLYARWLRAVLFNSLGEYAKAFVSARLASAEAPRLNVSSWALPELIEASVRTDNAAAGREALDRLTEVAAAADTEWASAIEARSRALLSDGAAAEACYREAINRLSRTELRPELARAHLLYGEWLRRQNRRAAARVELRIAYAMFTEIGMLAFGNRARRELQAAGETVRKRQEDTRNDLTPQEEQIARLAIEGRTNSEIGAHLYISARTVEWHLRKVFTKLGVTSRRGLRTVLPAPNGDGPTG
jgi:DNA-binding CsgD family transcriptional regulator